jgi:hypothetical protein
LPLVRIWQVIQQFKVKGMSRSWPAWRITRTNRRAERLSRESAAAETATQTAYWRRTRTSRHQLIVVLCHCRRLLPVALLAVQRRLRRPYLTGLRRRRHTPTRLRIVGPTRRSKPFTWWSIYGVTVATAVISVADQIQPPPVKPSATPTQAKTSTWRPFIHAAITRAMDALTDTHCRHTYSAVNFRLDLCIFARDNYK